MTTLTFSGRYRPTCSTDDVKELLQSLNISEPESITFPTTQGALNQIVVLEWSEETLKQVLETHNVIARPIDSSTRLLLRIASGELPQIKLENEAATLLWVAANTTIPVPRVICHDSTTDNVLKHEYMIMTFSEGVPGSTLYPTLTTEAMDHILDQLADYTLQLHQKPFDRISGLKTTKPSNTTATASSTKTTNPQITIVPGPLINENQWTIPEIRAHWPPQTTFELLNPTSSTGYPSLTSYLTAKLTCYIKAIPIHPALTSLPYLTERNINLLKQFLDVINQPQHADRINDTRYILAHRDLHFGQLLVDPTSFDITAVLDWEFAGVVPVPLWRGSFLWRGFTNTANNKNNTGSTPSDPSSPPSAIDDEQRAETTLLRRRWETRMRELEVHGGKGKEMLRDAKWRSREQEAAWDVVDLMRCIVEVVPRGVQMGDAKGWWGGVLEGLRGFGIDSGGGGGGHGQGYGFGSGQASTALMGSGTGSIRMGTAEGNAASFVMERVMRRSNGDDLGSGKRDAEIDVDTDITIDAGNGVIAQSPEPDDVVGSAIGKILLDVPMEKNLEAKEGGTALTST